MMRMRDTVWNECSFDDCKMLGLRWDECSASGLSLSFKNCQLDHSVFYKLKLPGTTFNSCRLLQCDFSETDLSGCIFSGSDLSDALFDRTKLDKADFRCANNYRIHPERNSIKKARFSYDGITGLLSSYDIRIDP
ncbi:hypothetical protein GCM10023092_25040 [Rurimicrobium arvi]|uniref:Pentapeptide repeat-containing protein n=2 Tax=Rurimicrobium arvi TaxID=2049916 RepID=A0ABP8MZ85_9BACT